jgi:hypothetical protein
MATTTAGTVTGNTAQYGYNQSWASLFTLMLKPQYWNELIQRYGPALGIFEALYFAGQTVDVAGYEKKVFEEGSIERSVTTHGTTAVAAAGANATMYLAATNFNTNKLSYLTVGDKVFIPAAYLEQDGAVPNLPLAYQVTDITANATVTSIKYTLTPLDEGTEIAVEIPAATELLVTGGNYAPGSVGAVPKASGWYERSFYTAIKRAAWAIEGSTHSDQRYFEELKGGGTGMFTKATIEADFLLNAFINDELLMGQVIDNLTLANRDSQANDARGTLGIWPTLDARGMKLYYTGTMTVPDFDLIKDLFISVGVTDKKASFFMGSTLMKYLENSGLDFIKEFSGGTDFTKAFNGIGVEIPAVKKNGIFVGFHELVNSSNPVKWGIDGYGFKSRGFIIPDTQVTVKDAATGVQMKMKNMVFGNKNYNGENRGRFMNILPGVNGMQGMVGTNLAVDRYDDVRGEIGSEFTLLINKAEQMIMVDEA